MMENETLKRSLNEYSLRLERQARDQQELRTSIVSLGQDFVRDRRVRHGMPPPGRVVTASTAGLTPAVSPTHPTAGGGGEGNELSFAESSMVGLYGVHQGAQPSSRLK